MSPQKSKRSSSSSRRPNQPHWVRIGIIVLVLVFAFGSVIALLAGGGDDDQSNVTAGTSPSTPSSTTPKPCVAVSEALPAGAPEVPVQVGPPPTQLVTQDLQVGTGATVNAGATVTVQYIGVSCSTGKIFDSSYSRGQPATFPLTGVIPGWQEGIPGMKVGGVRLLGIPPDKAYGEQGSPPAIGPNETLWFVVTVQAAK